MAEGNYYIVKQSSLTEIADAIREKGGTSESLSFPNGFVNAVGALSTSGGSGTSGLLVTISNNDGYCIADKTVREIQTALDNGINPSFKISQPGQSIYISLANLYISSNGHSSLSFTSLFTDKSGSALTADSLDDYPEYYSDN